VGVKIEKNEMGGGMWREWGRREVCKEYWWGNLRERVHWGDTDIDGMIILRWIFQEVGVGGGEWVELAQDRYSWRALVSTVKKLQVP
jgi:hypothetical protein